MEDLKPEERISLTKLPPEFVKYLKIYATIVNCNGATYYLLPWAYKLFGNETSEGGGYFEVIPIDKLPDDVADFVPELNKEK